MASHSQFGFTHIARGDRRRSLRQGKRHEEALECEVWAKSPGPSGAWQPREAEREASGRGSFRLKESMCQVQSAPHLEGWAMS